MEHRHIQLKRAPAASFLLVLSCGACQGDWFMGKVGGRQSSAGNVTRVERRPQIAVKGESKPAIVAPRGQTLVVLSLEGRSELTFESPSSYSLVDKTGKEYPLYFAGSPTPEGGVTAEGWEFVKGGRLTMGGRWAYSGTAKLPGPKIVFIYVVPQGATELRLRDGDSIQSLEEKPQASTQRKGADL